MTFCLFHNVQPGSRLEMHLDYSIHPVTGKERRVNLIIYMNKDWKDEWGGELNLWEGTPTAMTRYLLRHVSEQNSASDVSVDLQTKQEHCFVFFIHVADKVHMMIAMSCSGPVRKISPKYNQAALFRTSDISWHGMPDPVYAC